MIKSLAIAALLAAPTTVSAQCVTRQQIADAAMTLTPYAVEAITEKCRAHVSATSFLAAKGTALHDRLAAEGAGREASAAKAILAIMGPDVPPIKDSESLVKVMGSMVSGMMVADLPIESCEEISGMLEAISPLPAQNIGLLAASAAGLVSEGQKAPAGKAKGAKAKGQFEICKDE
ncbi:MAG TPA: hypothetical protein VF655_08525 [Allosphingosinicella sp.]|jgi:hypothetical protein